MSSIAEWLRQQGPETEQHHGVTTLDLAELPPPLRMVTRLVLRETEVSYPDLCSAVAALPEADRLTQPELDEALEALRRQRWLIGTNEGAAWSYKVNLRRRAGRALSRSTWAALEDDEAPNPLR